MRRAVVWVVVALIACLMTNRAGASSIYAFDQATYTVTVGSTVTIPVYLQLADDNFGLDYSHMVSDDGMFTIGMRLTQDTVTPPQPTQAATIASMADVMPNNVEFDSSLAIVDYVSSSNAGLSVQVPLAAMDGPQNTSGQPAGRFLIGNFKFTAGNVAGETTIFDAQDLFAPPSNDTVTFNGTYVLDPLGTAAVNILTVPALGPAAVPVPAAAWAGLMLLGVLALMRLVSRHRRA